MEIELLVKSFGVLILILGILLYFLLSNSKKKSEKKRKTTQRVKREYPTFESLVDTIKDKKATQEQLLEAIENILKYYGTIHPKLGIRSHPDFDIYGFIMLKICHHPNTNKKIILKYDKELRAKNPEYTREINDFLTKGLDSRGF